MARDMSSASAAAVMLPRSAIRTKTSAAVMRSIFDRLKQQTIACYGVFRSNQETYDSGHDCIDPPSPACDPALHLRSAVRLVLCRGAADRGRARRPGPGHRIRSEEHTSELQSRFDL